ncbi:PhoPQ-activated pathogenicity-related protein [Cyclobacterium xiamenense]|uniref:PhoPQ-activated pathogenicity-related protein n=1 Tax=Cyclobacterium xiamenense TaxID=1297121 RepID=A0A1H6Z7M7_9BACT|nr:PhoPQ-activated pathogenicity-related protein [Cyclobacterium xiamenense]
MPRLANPLQKPARLLAYLFFTVLAVQCQPKSDQQTAVSTTKGIDLLKSYVAKNQEAFTYELVHEQQEETHAYYVLKMTSQNWLGQSEVSPTTWWHYVSFVIPKELKYETSLMVISGGSSGTKLPENPDELILEASLLTGSPVIKVHNIPFQPVQYVGDSLAEKRTEDGLIAYGWREFMERGATDEAATWLARFPMTEAVVSAMDAVVDFGSKNLDLSLEKYVVAGASKRGWTTWTTAAVDDRVVGMVPIVIDMLNLQPSFMHHWQSYGFWAPAVDDYTREGIFDWINSREFARLQEIVEPYQFLDEYREIPKLLINATGDQFFLPDSWKFYWSELTGEKHLAYIPNAGHSLDGSDAIEVMLGFYAQILADQQRPQYSWEVTDEAILVQTDPNNPPASVKLWVATNPSKRDFRIDELGPEWTSTTIPLTENGNYRIPLSSPEKGWTGHFVELTYAGNAPLKFTTGVKVLPETYANEPFVPKSPKGTPLP